LRQKIQEKQQAIIICHTVQKIRVLRILKIAQGALIFVKDKKSALALAAEFEKYTKRMSIRVYCAYD